MKEFINKLIGRLEKQAEQYRNRGFEYEKHRYSAMADKYYAKECSYLHSIEIVNELAEEYKGGWIPCSERLPNGSELWLDKDITDAEPRQFIVMVKGADEPTTGYYTSNGWVQDVYNKDNKNGYANEIVAWRFFPEPYKEV